MSASAAALRDGTEYLVFGGGGARALSFVGALNTFFDGSDAVAAQWYAKQLRGTAGTSMGAALAVCVALSIVPSRMKSLLHELRLDRITTNLNFVRMTTHLGLTDGSVVLEIAGRILAERGLAPDATFEDVRAVTGKDLALIAVNVTDSATVVMSSRATPGMEVRRAVRASTSLPLLFEPVVMGDAYVVDGAIHRNIPYDLFPPSRTLAFKVAFESPLAVTPGRHTASDLLALITNIVGCALEKQAEDLHEQSPCRVVETRPSVTTTSFSLTESQWAEVWRSGAVAMQAFLLKPWFVGAITAIMSGARQVRAPPPTPIMPRRVCLTAPVAISEPVASNDGNDGEYDEEETAASAISADVASLGSAVDSISSGVSDARVRASSVLRSMDM